MKGVMKNFLGQAFLSSHAFLLFNLLNFVKTYQNELDLDTILGDNK